MPGGDRDRRSAGDVVTPRSSSASSRRSLLTLPRHGHRFFSSKANYESPFRILDRSSIDRFTAYQRHLTSRRDVLYVTFEFRTPPQLRVLNEPTNRENRRKGDSQRSFRTYKHTHIPSSTPVSNYRKQTSMLSINMRIFKTVLLLAAFCSNRIGQCLPVTNETSIVESSSSTTTSTVDHYDQRQNGSENYRIHVDGLIFVVAPAETLLLAGAAADDKPNLPIIDSLKPPSSKPEVDHKPPLAPKSVHRAGLRLANLLMPLLRRIQHE